APARPASRIDRLTRQARLRYGEEVHGSAVHLELRRIAADPGLRAALRSGDTTRLHSYVTRRFNGVWYHQHVSRMRLVRGSRILADTGVPFVVAPAQTVIRDAGGRSLATLQVSIQDVIGYARFMHRNFPVDVVVRGQGPGHVRASLPAAMHMTLPARGTVAVGGRRMAVRSFQEPGLGGERLTVWVLAPA
ncbi:MAG: diguanylate cyclase, partial [Conexibacter sp.]|nr:diguanylate cyclase [Conexibacter sp.]